MHISCTSLSWNIETPALVCIACLLVALGLDHACLPRPRPEVDLTFDINL